MMTADVAIRQTHGSDFHAAVIISIASAIVAPTAPSSVCLQLVQTQSHQYFKARKLRDIGSNSTPETSHEPGIPDCIDRSIAGSAPDLGVQLWVGLRPERRIGTGTADPDRTNAHGQDLDAAVCTAFRHCRPSCPNITALPKKATSQGAQKSWNRRFREILPIDAGNCCSMSCRITGAA